VITVPRFSRRERALIAALTARPGVVTHAELECALQRPAHGDRYVAVLVHRVRAKLARIGWSRVIRTVPGVGYVLREEPAPPPSTVALCVREHSVYAWGVLLPVTRGELNLLTALSAYRGRVLPRPQLARLIGAPGLPSRALDSRVYSLRQTLATVAVGGVPAIKTVRGVGHQLVC